MDLCFALFLLFVVVVDVIVLACFKFVARGGLLRGIALFIHIFDPNLALKQPRRPRRSYIG